MKPRKRPMLLCLAGLCLATRAAAAPFEETVRFVQPDGSALELWGKGDEFYAVFETLDGYTVLFDPAARAYVYAARAPGGVDLVSSGLLVGQGDPAARGLEKHLRMSQETIQKTAKERFDLWDAATQTSQLWQQKKAALQALEEAGPRAGPCPPRPPPPRWASRPASAS